MVAYFEYFIDDSLKNGNVTKGIEVLKVYNTSHASRKRHNYRNVERSRPEKRLQLTAFEEKGAFFLQDN